MNRLPHRAVGAAVGLTLAAHTHTGPLLGAAIVGVAALTAAGRTSPDVDQTWPDTDHGPRKHRGITHWWGIPALALYLLPGSPLIVAAIAGWTSHLAGDFLFGRAHYRDGRKVRGPGIPVLPWGWHVGLGLRSGGIPATLTAYATLALAIWSAL